jgi:hypothetical protein
MSNARVFARFVLKQLFDGVELPFGVSVCWQLRIILVEVRFELHVGDVLLCGF